MKNDNRRRIETVLSRRLLVGSSGMAALGLLARQSVGQEREWERMSAARDARLSSPMQERVQQQRAFSERMRSAGSMEERMAIMEEQRAWEHKRAVESLKEQLGLSEQEWAVIRPRIQAVYDLVHPQAQMRPGGAQPTNEVEQKRRDLQELLREENAPADQIKTRLTALRAARERATQRLAGARQSLRQLMTLRQEAVLVLNGLLD